MKNQIGTLSLLLSMLFLTSYVVVAMEYPSKKFTYKSEEDIERDNEMKAQLKDELVRYLTSDEYLENDYSSRKSMAKYLNGLEQKYSHLLTEKVPGRQSTFSQLIGAVANRFRLVKKSGIYKAPLLKDSTPRRR